MPRQFTRYSEGEVEPDQIPDLAQQYEGVDLGKLMGLDEDNLPFLISDDTGVLVCFWNSYNGIMVSKVRDPVRKFAYVEYLKRNGHPVFEDISAAKFYAEEKGWPRKLHPSEQQRT